jgi:hypothetical protein
MSDIRSSFYQAINKANDYKPKPKPKKVKQPIEEKLSIDELILKTINEVESAISFEENIVINNEKIIEYIFNKVKDDNTLQRNKEIDEINKERDIRRREWVKKMRELEIIERAPTVSSSSAAAGAGAGGSGNRRQLQKYFELGFIEFGYIE